jgi:hypothetical protein
MAAHRYWRLSGLSARGADSPLTLTELQLRDAAALLTTGIPPASTVAPQTGTLAGLTDGLTSSAVSWAAKDIPRLVLTWDFGSAIDVTDIQVGSGPNPYEFLLGASLDYSDDGAVWTPATTYFAIKWPGPNTLTTSALPGALWSLKGVATQGGSFVSTDRRQARPSGGAMIKGEAYHSTGVRQFEVVFTTPGGDPYGGVGYLGIGVGTPDHTNGYFGSPVGTFALKSNANAEMSGVSVPYGNFAMGDVIGVVVDFSVGSLTFYKNGVSMGVASATGMLGLRLTPHVGDLSGSGGRICYATIEPSAFAYPVAGADPWTLPPTILLEDLAMGRVTVDAGAAILFPGAAAAVPNPAPINASTLTLGDWLDPGNGRVRGTVNAKGTPNTPVHRKVRLIRESDGLVVREAWSNGATGAYDFQGLRMDYLYTVLSYDYTGAFRAVVADGQIPEVMA